MECRIIITTYPERKQAVNIARESVDAKLVACVNIIKVRSIYTWKGKIEEVDEFLVLFKTTEKGADILKDYIKRNHVYEVPEIVEIDPKYVDPRYLSWLIDNVKIE